MWRSLIPSLVTAILCFGGGDSANAQVFIPDLVERAALNAAIPGVVDGDGMMDISHPDIAALTEFQCYANAATMNLVGVQYLISLNDLQIGLSGNWSGPNQLSCAGLPDGVNHLSAFATRGTIDLPALPSGLMDLELSGNPGQSGDTLMVHVANLPAEMNSLHLTDIDSIDWGTAGHCGQITLTFVDPPPFTFVLPTINVSTVDVDGSDLAGLDLSHASVTWLILEYSHIAGPITWPSVVQHLSVEYLSTAAPLPPFPVSLETFEMYGSEGICLPYLPDGLTDMSFDQLYGCIPNWPVSLTSALLEFEPVSPEDMDYCSVLNSSCPGPYPGVSGRILIDLDQNGVCDDGEPGLPQALISLLPNGSATGCDTSGFWEVGVQPGSYTIIPSSSYPYLQSIVPTEHTANVPNMGDADTQNDFAVTLIPDIHDLRADLCSEPARPGFDNRLYLTCQNYGTVPMDAELSLSFDADQTWVSSSLAPGTQTSTTATWQFSGMGIGTTQQITVDLNTASTVALGTLIDQSVSALPTSGDATPLDNVIAETDSVVGGFDPNDKQVRPSALTPSIVQAGATSIAYTIRFQNTGTFMAERVVIVDTLPDGLQPQSVEFLSSSHTCHWYVLDGVLHAIHEDINLPDNTSDEPGSHGYIRFRILPDTDLPDGTEVLNIAHIVFDFNEPIITPPSVFRVDVLASVQETAAVGMHVHPNPVQDRLSITLPRNDQTQVNYAVQDLTGRNVLTGRTNGNGIIDVSGLSAGVFVLAVKSDAVILSTRFMKQ